MKRIFYIQYTNPAGYPPLEHSSRILGDDGWQVTFLGTGALGADALRFPPHPNIRVRRLSFCRPGWRQKLHYSYFCLWVFIWALLARPVWIYVSDALACPAALALGILPWLRILYHEHDSPAPPAGAFQRLVHWARRRVANRAAACILPNETRLERFKAEMGMRHGMFCVWNCPSSSEVAPERAADNGNFWLLYHGSIVPERLPFAVVDALAALPDSVRLRVIGYETVGSVGYIGRLQQRARQIGVDGRLQVVDALPRRDLMEWCRRCDAGLALMPLSSADINLQAMTGASNKPFDYLASGLPLLVSDLPDWRAEFVQPGYGFPCDPQDADSIAGAVRRFLEDPGLARAMGEMGRRRILDEWNYEACFQPVRRCLEA